MVLAKDHTLMYIKSLVITSLKRNGLSIDRRDDYVVVMVVAAGNCAGSVATAVAVPVWFVCDASRSNIGGIVNKQLPKRDLTIFNTSSKHKSVERVNKRGA
ncbi:unnamed protein product, partial [Ceratitis capitata]